MRTDTLDRFARIEATLNDHPARQGDDPEAMLPMIENHLRNVQLALQDNPRYMRYRQLHKNFVATHESIRGAALLAEEFGDNRMLEITSKALYLLK